MAYTATPKKLSDGTWGAWVETTDADEGDTIEITTRGGKSWKAEISEIIRFYKTGMAVRTRKIVRESTTDCCDPYEYEYERAERSGGDALATAKQVAFIRRLAADFGQTPKSPESLTRRQASRVIDAALADTWINC